MPRTTVCQGTCVLILLVLTAGCCNTAGSGIRSRQSGDGREVSTSQTAGDRPPANFEDLRSLIDPEMFPYIRLIQSVPSFGQGFGSARDDFDPIPLIRCVNALQPLGKDKALRALHAYCALADGDSLRQQKYDLCTDRVFMVARLLFVRADGDPRMPWMYIGVPDVMIEPGDRQWPLFPLVVQDDIPFCLVGGYDSFGVPQSPLEHLDYCQAHCQIRPSPLHPSASPVLAAEQIFGSRRWRNLPDTELREIERERHKPLDQNDLNMLQEMRATKDRELQRLEFRLRCQALRALGLLTPELARQLAPDEATVEQANRVWAERLHDPRLGNVRWDSSANDFVVSAASGSR